MLNIILQQYLMEKLISEDHPTIEYHNCTNSRQRRKICTTCRDVCRKDVIGYKPYIDWDNCVNCNICASQCPSRAIRSSAINLGKLLELYESKAEHIVISCRHKEKVATDLKLYCIASIPWEVSAYLALEKQVVFLNEGCEYCEDNVCLTAFEETMERTKEFLGANRFNKNVIIAKEDELPPAPVMSRRELFSLFGKRSKNVVASVIPDDDSIKIDGMVYRKLLTKRLKKSQENCEEQSFGWSTRVFTENCWGCGICAKVCPHKAIEVVESDSVRYMAHSLWRCERCGICESVCLEQGLMGTRIEYVNNSMKPILTQINYDTCDICGSSVKPGNELCYDCATKKHASKCTDSPLTIMTPY